jgi:protein ImuB
MRRVVSLFLPAWSTDRLRRKSAKPQPDVSASDAVSAGLVTSVPDHGRRLVAAVDVAARRLGVMPGMTIAKARFLVPELAVVDADPDADLNGLRQIALWAGQRYSPIVAMDPPDGIWLDITGCAQLFDNERALLKDLHRRSAGFGLSVQIAVADTAGCAHAVARHVTAGRPVTIEPGDHRKAIALLPILALRLEAGVVEALRKLGFERVEQLIGEPRGPLAKRFGRSLFHRLDQAMGLMPEPIRPIFAEELLRCHLAFMDPIGTADAFARVIGDLAREMAGQLGARAHGARRLDCYFHRVDGHIQAIRVGTALPSREPAHLAKLLCARIETIDPGLGIETMTLVASLTEPLDALQGDNLAGPSRTGPDLAALIDALANRFGERQLYRTVPHASAMPERASENLPALAKADGAAWCDQMPRPSRMLFPPEPIEVIALQPDHPPAMFIWRRRRFRVTGADGPERLHGEWWRTSGMEAIMPLAVRDYYQVETTSGGRYWLFRQGDGENTATGRMRWFLHGAFA